MSNNTAQNKAVVTRFNKECIEQGNEKSMEEILANDVINHSALAGMNNGKESFYFFLKNVLHKSFSDLKVEILDQVAERDLVTTRKRIHAVHTGEINGIAPSHKPVEINIIDIIRLRDGKYAEHWGMSNFSEVIAWLAES